MQKELRARVHALCSAPRAIKKGSRRVNEGFYTPHFLTFCGIVLPAARVRTRAQLFLHPSPAAERCASRESSKCENAAVLSLMQ